MLAGMGLHEAIYRSTVTPARTIGRFPEIGTLGEGRDADVAILQMETGVFSLHDARGMKRLARQRLVNVLTVRAGEVVYDRDGRAFQDWDTPGAYMGVR
jgi:dihydroorotase